MGARKDHLDGFAIALLLACCLFWGFQQVLVKATLAELPPVFQSTLRAAGATGLVWLGALAQVAGGIVLVNRKA